MKKKFVLDTNVILSDPRCIYKFDDNDVYIPLIVIEEVDESYGDEWHSEIRVGYTFFFPDKTAYTFAYVNTIEDDENWAQAESYSSIDFREYYDSNKITVNELITKLKKVL